MTLFPNDNIRELFPATKRYAYLNSAAVAPLPSISADAVKRQLEDVSNHGSSHYGEWVAMKNRCRTLAAGMLNVRSDQIAFVRNTSDGFAAAARGISWNEGDNVVSFAGEFPANFYPWRSVRDRFGVELRLCREVNGRVDVEELIGMIDARTRVVTISAVQFASGYKADLERIGAVAKKAGALFSVDIIQAFGAMPLDLSGLGVDIAAGASHKWLCSPEGCGILYLSDRARQEIEPILTGWISVVDPWDFNDTEQPFQPNSLVYESGTGPAALFYGLAQSLTLLDHVGLGNIERCLEGLSDYLCERLAEKNYELISSRTPGEKSQIVCVKHRGGIPSSDIFKHLESRGVIVSPRGDRLRIAPHFFNDVGDIDRLISELP